MNVDEIEIVQRLIIGHWPQPPMTPEEQLQWARTLGRYGYEDAVDVLDMIAEAGAKWRPTDGEFVAEYRTRTERPKGFPALTSNGDLTPERVHELVEMCRAQLQLGAKGPRHAS